MEAATNGANDAPAKQQKLLYAATIRINTTPFRSDKFALAFLERLPKMMDFGASGYSFIRSDNDKTVFFFVSYWEDKKDFEQWWFSRELQEMRTELLGHAELPTFPSWHTVLEQYGITS